MIDVVAVRFKKAGKLYYFDPNGIELDIGQDVVVETSRGVEFGKIFSKKEVLETDLHSELKPIIRLAKTADIEQYEQNKIDAESARIDCEKIIEKHGLEMNLIDTEYTFDKSKLIFYFTADGRVDFRELVKELASVFRTRIELRQVGVRDEAKLIKSLGPCGQDTCCSSWIGEFSPVSIKMAKEQNLSLNPTKISGVCGRLLCCLNFENDHYVEVNKRLPSFGEVIYAPCGKSLTMNSNPLKEEVTVRLIKGYNEEDDRYELADESIIYKVEEIERRR